MKNCIIIHGCPSFPKPGNPNERHWLPWLRDKLKEQGYKVELPSMPDPVNPKYNDWKNTFKKQEINEDTVIVTHSCGGAFIVHWLGDTRQKIKKLILVAPAKILGDNKERMLDMYNFEIDPSIKERVEEIVVFTSNDEERHRESAKIYADALGAKLYDLENKGHYAESSMGTKEFPELLEEMLK